MHSKIAIAAFLGIVAAMPNDISLGAEEAFMQDIAHLDKRDKPASTSTAATCKNTPASACQKQPDGYGPMPSSDTVADFIAYDGFFQWAANAATPPNYVRSFQNYDGSTSTSNLITYSSLTKYDPALCAAKCDAEKNCVAFNLYFERDPSLSPHKDCCPNPKSTTTIKCGLWGTYITSQTATNKGQFREQFQVVIAGSNGYNKDKAGSTTSAAPTSANVTSKAATSAPTTTTSSSTSTSSSTTSSATSSTSPSTTTSSTTCLTPIPSPIITLNVNRTTIYGENIFLAGSIPQLGTWNIDNSYAMSSFGYTSDHTNWFATLQLPAGTQFEYKYFQRNLDYSITWENPPNGKYTVPSGCEKEVVVYDQWQ